jgi:GH43 family beta-xylosidase
MECKDNRSPRAQKFTWNADGTPNFGEPVSINVPIKKPSGE